MLRMLHVVAVAVVGPQLGEDLQELGLWLRAAALAAALTAAPRAVAVPGAALAAAVPLPGAVAAAAALGFTAAFVD